MSCASFQVVLAIAWYHKTVLKWIWNDTKKCPESGDPSHEITLSSTLTIGSQPAVWLGLIVGQLNSWPCVNVCMLLVTMMMVRIQQQTKICFNLRVQFNFRNRWECICISPNKCLTNSNYENFSFTISQFSQKNSRTLSRWLEKSYIPSSRTL